MGFTAIAEDAFLGMYWTNIHHFIRLLLGDVAYFVLE